MAKTKKLYAPTPQEMANPFLLAALRTGPLTLASDTALLEALELCAQHIGTARDLATAARYARRSAKLRAILAERNIIV